MTLTSSVLDRPVHGWAKLVFTSRTSASRPFSSLATPSGFLRLHKVEEAPIFAQALRATVIRLPVQACNVFKLPHIHHNPKRHVPGKLTSILPHGIGDLGHLTA
jgi:hypothetical protein